MKRLFAALLLAPLLLAFASDADAARRWFVQTSDNKIVSFTDDDNAPTPAGTTAVADSVIRLADPPGATGDIVPLGTWDGTTYAPPSGGGFLPPPYDSTTDSGQVKDAAHNMMDVFEAALALIETNYYVWPHSNVEKATDGIHWMMVACARVALNSTRTHANRLKWLDEAASWPTGLSGDPLQYVDAMDDNFTAPTPKWSWVNDATDPPGRHALSGSADAFAPPANVEDAPSTAELISREWINDIP